MKQLVILFTTLLLLSCEDSSDKRATPTRDKASQEAELSAVKAWSDSLSAAVATFRVEESTTISMKKSQERLLSTLNYEKRREVYLTRDSLYIDGYPTLSGENDYDDLPQLFKQKNRNRYMTDHLPDSIPWVVIFKATDDAKTNHLLHIIPHFQEAGYHHFTFVAKASDLPSLPSIPDSSYYNWIMNKLNKTPATQVNSKFADIAVKRFRNYKELLRAFDQSANMPYMERVTYLCDEFHPHVIGKEDKEKLLTLLYTKAYMTSLRTNALARTFKMENGAKEITIPTRSSMKELFDKIMSEEAIAIELKVAH